MLTSFLDLPPALDILDTKYNRFSHDDAEPAVDRELLSPVLCRIVRHGRVWRCVDDLGSTQVALHAVAQDSRGYLWIGSEDGPMVFDGLAWSYPAGLHALRGHLVHTIIVTNDTTLWIGTEGAGVACVDLSTTPPRLTHHLTQLEGLPSNSVRSICADHENRIWLGTMDGIAVLRNGSVQQVISAAEGLPTSDIRKLCCDAQGRIWAGTARGLTRIGADGTIVQPAEEGKGLFDTVSALCADEHGAVWMGTISGSLYHIAEEAGEQFVAYQINQNLGKVEALYSDRQHRLWVGTASGLHMLEAATWHAHLTIAEGLPANRITALIGDRQGRIWFCTLLGLAVIQEAPIPVHTLGPEADLPSPMVFAFVVDRQDRVWLGTEAGLHVIDRTSRQPVDFPALAPMATQGPIWSLEIDQQGKLWAGTGHAGLLCLDQDSGALLTQIDLARDVPCIYCRGERQLWAALSARGLARIDTQTMTALYVLDIGDGLPQALIRSLQQDNQGLLWAGTLSGWLVCIDPERGVVLDTLQLGTEVARHPIDALALDSQGMLWAGTLGGGVLMIDPIHRHVTRTFTTADGLPSNSVYACRVDWRGHIWVGTRRGVARFVPAFQRWTVFSRGLGLPHDECNSRALYQDVDDQLWIGMVHGVGIVETARIPAEVPPCALYLTRLTVMGQEREIVPGMTIEDSDYDLHFEYGALTFTAAAQVRYRVQLVGLEREWSPATTQRSARYTNLRPGRYTFRVCARNWGGRWSEPCEVGFHVIRNSQAQEMEEALERERIEKEVYRATAQRLEELNHRLEEADRLKSVLIEQARAQAEMFERMARHDSLTGLLSRRALDEELAGEFERARRYERPLSVVMADIDKFKDVNDTFGHRVGDQVLQRVADLCRFYTRRDDIVGRYGGEELAIVLPETSIDQALELCERLRKGVESADWEAVAAGLRVTISMGISSWIDAPDHEKLLSDADRYLYQAKNRGRDQVRSPFDGISQHHR